MSKSNSKVFGYARVSTKDQSLNSQVDLLLKSGVDKDFLFKETASGRSDNRPIFNSMLDKLRDGDTVIVTDLDRLGRTSKQLIELLNYFNERSINFKSMSQGVFDTTSPMGKAVFEIMAILKAMEVEVLRERTNRGLEAARARGKKGGRKKGTKDLTRYNAVVALYKSGAEWSEIENITKASRSTISRWLHEAELIK